MEKDRVGESYSWVYGWKVKDEYRNWLNDPILGNIRSVALMIAVIYG